MRALAEAEDAWLELEERRAASTVRIGLTGPIGCGKSTVARWLARATGARWSSTRTTWRARSYGTRTADVHGRLSPVRRAACGRTDARPGGAGAVVFADPAALRALEAIVHPAVRPRILEAIDGAEAAARRPSSSRRSSSSRAASRGTVRRGLARDLRSGRPAGPLVGRGTDPRRRGDPDPGPGRPRGAPSAACPRGSSPPTGSPIGHGPRSSACSRR